MLNHELASDVTAQKVARTLLIFQLVALLPIIIISLTKYASIAFTISLLFLISLAVALAWLYSRYQALALVREKNKLQGEINKLRHGIQLEDTRIQRAKQERANLGQSEKQELENFLKKLQDNYINKGFSQAYISNAAIPGIGPKLKERLITHNVQAASDVTTNSVTRIEGFGAAKTQAVLAWKDSVFVQLNATKPTFLPPEKEMEIKDKYQTKHHENDADEQKAKDKKIALEKEHNNLAPALKLYSHITFQNYLLQALAPKRTVAVFIAAVLLVSQICLFTSSAAGKIAVSLPEVTATPTIDLAALQLSIEQTIIANFTQTAPTTTSTLLPTPTSTTYVDIPPVENPLFSPIPPLPGASLRLHLIDVGQGDAILIQGPAGEVILIDGGEENSGALQYVQSLGIQNINLMIATHPHADHIGGLVEVLRTIPVQKVITNGELHTTSTYEQFLDAIAAAKAEYIEVKRGDVITEGNINFKVLNPGGNTSTDLNESSVVLQFTYGQTTFLLMGDSGAETEKELLASGLLLKADILKVGHHGSKTGSTPEFLNAVNPEVALYSAGVNNSYGHPAPQTISALTTVGAAIYGTDQQGTIVVTIDKNGYSIKTAKEAIPATPMLAPIPLDQPQASNLLEILSVTSPINPGSTATLKAMTSPGASCSITVYYKSGPSKAQGLDSKTANAKGEVSWSWKVGSRTTSGNWPIDVICDGISKQITFEVK